VDVAVREYWKMGDRIGEDVDLRALLSILDPHARDILRRVLIRDQADRDAIASNLLRYRAGRSDEWADIIDMMTNTILPPELELTATPNVGKQALASIQATPAVA
jgi:hypothetical protein